MSLVLREFDLSSMPSTGRTIMFSQWRQIVANPMTPDVRAARSFPCQGDSAFTDNTLRLGYGMPTIDPLNLIDPAVYIRCAECRTQYVRLKGRIYAYIRPFSDLLAESAIPWIIRKRFLGREDRH